MCLLPQCLWLESRNCRQRLELLARYRSRHVMRLILTVSTSAKSSNRCFYFNTLSPGPVGGDLPRFPHRPREGYIVRPRSPSWRFLLILPLHYWTLQFVHDAPRKQPSRETWFGILGNSRTIVDSGFLLWCVFVRASIWLIYKFDNRVVFCALLCIGCYLCVRFLLPASHLFFIKIWSLEL